MSISESMPNGSRVLACRGRHAGWRHQGTRHLLQQL